MITIMKNQLMAEQYEELLQVTSDRICLRFCDRRMIIQGKDLKGCLGGSSVIQASVSFGEATRMDSI